MNVTFLKTFFINNRPVSLAEQFNVMPEYYERLRSLLKIKRIVGKNFIRFGRANDGGYIMVDNFSISGGGEDCVFFRNK